MGTGSGSSVAEREGRGVDVVVEGFEAVSTEPRFLEPRCGANISARALINAEYNRQMQRLNRKLTCLERQQIFLDEVQMRRTWIGSVR